MSITPPLPLPPRAHQMQRLSPLLLPVGRQPRHLLGDGGRPGFLVEAGLLRRARAVVRTRVLLYMCDDLVRHYSIYRCVYYVCHSSSTITGVFTNATTAREYVHTRAFASLVAPKVAFFAAVPSQSTTNRGQESSLSSVSCLFLFARARAARACPPCPPEKLVFF